MNKILIITALAFLTSCNYIIVNEKELEKAVKVSAEFGYFEGQRDALEKDIRIKRVDSTWIWTKSCWNDGRSTIFDPTKSMNNNLELIFDK